MGESNERCEKLSLEATTLSGKSVECDSENWEDHAPPAGQLYAQKQESVNDRTILVKVHLELYPISWEILEKIFSGFGTVEYLEILCPREDYHSKIRFQKKESAIRAFDSLNHRDIYDRCCQMELMMMSNSNALNSSGGKPQSSMNESCRRLTEITEQMRANFGQTGDDLQCSKEAIKASSQGFMDDNEAGPASGDEPDSDEGLSGFLKAREEIGFPQEINEVPKYHRVQSLPLITEELKKPENNEDIRVKVYSNPYEDIICDEASNELSKLSVLLIELMEIRLAKFRIILVGCWRNFNAYKMFQMPRQKVGILAGNEYIMNGELSLKVGSQLNSLVFDPGGEFDSLNGEAGGAGGINIKASYDQRSCISVARIANNDLRFVQNGQCVFPLDRGKTSIDVLNAQIEFWKAKFDLKVVVLVFDPGGMGGLWIVFF